METGLKRVSVLGLPIDLIEADQFEIIINSILDSEKQEQIRFLSYSDFISAIFSREKKNRLKSCALIVTTSRRVLNATKFIYSIKSSLFNQFNFTIKLLGHIENKSGSIYMVGGRKKDLEKTEANLRTSFPGISVVGRYWGHFNKYQECSLIEAVRKAAPTLLIAGSGIKSKDNWIYRNKEKLSRGISLYTKECFPVFAGKRSRPKKIIQYLRKPWTILQLFSMIWFYPAILISKISKSKS